MCLQLTEQLTFVSIFSQWKLFGSAMVMTKKKHMAELPKFSSHTLTHIHKEWKRVNEKYRNNNILLRKIQFVRGHSKSFFKKRIETKKKMRIFYNIQQKVKSLNRRVVQSFFWWQPNFGFWISRYLVVSCCWWDWDALMIVPRSCIHIVFFSRSFKMIQRILML